MYEFGLEADAGLEPATLDSLVETLNLRRAYTLNHKADALARC